MEVAVERPVPVKEEKRADAKPEMAAVSMISFIFLLLFNLLFCSLLSSSTQRRSESDHGLALNCGSCR
jgi:hypothetical protein